LKALWLLLLQLLVAPATAHGQQQQQQEAVRGSDLLQRQTERVVRMTTIQQMTQMLTGVIT
jgi:hypothetical protein